MGVRVTDEYDAGVVVRVTEAGEYIVQFDSPSTVIIHGDHPWRSQAVTVIKTAAAVKIEKAKKEEEKQKLEKFKEKYEKEQKVKQNEERKRRDEEKAKLKKGRQGISKFYAKHSELFKDLLD